MDVSNDLLRRQVTIIGSWTFSKHGQAECADFVADKKLDVDKLFTHRWSLDQAEDGIRDCLLSRGLGDVYKRQPNYCNLSS